jgi:hypothetical protein
MKQSRLASGLIGASISLATTLLLLSAMEIVLRYTHTPPYQWDLRLMFFSEGEVYQNKSWGGFLYRPNARIHSLTYYITDRSGPELAKEYEYDIVTNSSGLVQRNDINGSKSSILFLGDSFTEGQGASPWFYDFEAHWPRGSRYQVINGGIQGTGIEAWERFYGDISKSANIEKLVIIFISDDWTRRIRQIPPQFLECLRDARRCDGVDPFLGLPENPDEADSQIRRIARARLDFLALKERSRNFLQSSQIYQQLLKPAYELWQPPNRLEFNGNKRAALQLVADLGPQNVLFIHLPQKDELRFGPNVVGKEAATFIRNNRFLFVDGFEKCQLGLADFHLRDGHLNAAGYEKLEKCISEGLRDVFHLNLDGDAIPNNDGSESSK